MSRSHAKDQALADAPVPVDQFATTATLAIPVAGLLASDPELRTAELTPAQWRKRLDHYLETPTS